MEHPSEKPPRQYADEILALPSRVERAAALERVPNAYRALVRTYVSNAFARRRHH